MNMFVIGIQLKIFVGLIVLAMIMALVPSVADFIFRKMKDMLLQSIQMLQ
jgi:flagellar biosynthetic protein FliR